jgi:signal peptidase II
MKLSRTWPTGLLIASIVLGVDQISKWWIVGVIMQPPRVIEITPFMNLVMGWNKGISFGVFNSDSDINTWLLPLVAALIVVFLLTWLVRTDRYSIATSLGLIIGGALGNLIDRLRFGAVADFLDFHFHGFHWPAFNVADASITVGAVILLFDSLFVRSESSKNEEEVRGNRL